MQIKNKKDKEALNLGLSSFYLELHKSGKNCDVVIGGVIGVLEFSEECALLSTYSGKINFFGEKLNVTVFENKTVQISGKIHKIGLT